MEDKTTILIVEDDKYISNFIAVSLQKDDYRVLVAGSAAEGLFMFSSHHPDILLLDLGLPDQDGLEVIRELRSFSRVPILVISARGQEKEKIEALDSGANDYMTKPFHMGELMARIRVIERGLTRITNQTVESSFTGDNLSVDFEKRRVMVAGQEIHLTPIEYKLLHLLIANKGKVLTHNYILKQVWGYESCDTKNVRVYMANLRRKIEKNTANPRHILTEVGVGYRFADE
ncbi:response regulator [Anoxynatronum buryatiense]|uniref:Stage 0 sporulation protein A homolog n=1 Tax=Anoxynatronum buryatiense TaxID=489973 RepID=A0AA46AIY1_9CLOT|nr:response regulator transcription factor [Anoxynatronum buryatiense]SMP55206.1 two component transcriptional regulator, winged helix family [Anoxynatronum buryatiense]